MQRHHFNFLISYISISDTFLYVHFSENFTTQNVLGPGPCALKISVYVYFRRIALGTLKTIGSSPRRLMLGFILISWFLSMWIANTAAAAMMIPIVTAVLEELKKNKQDSGVDNKVRDSLTAYPLTEDDASIG